MLKKIKRYFYNRKIEKIAASLLPILLLDEVYIEKENAIYDAVFSAKQLVKEVWND